MKRVNKDVKISNLALICALFSIGILIIRCSQLALAEKVDGVDLQVLANSRITKKITNNAHRGTIYDAHGNVLAQDVSSYTLIAYLDPKRTTNENNPQHVVDKENTAVVLSAILGIEEETVLKYLNKENVYQTEFGTKGKGLNELTKKKLDETYIVVYAIKNEVNIKKADIIEKNDIYTLIGVDIKGTRHLLNIYADKINNSHFWLDTFEGLKSRGVKNILFLSVDDNKNMKRTAKIAFPNITFTA